MSTSRIGEGQMNEETPYFELLYLTIEFYDYILLKTFMENYHHLKAVHANYVYRFNVIAIKTPIAFLAAFDKMILLTYLKKTRAGTATKFVKKKNIASEMCLASIKTYI